MELAVKKKCVIGIDLSLEGTTYALVDVRGNILARGQLSTVAFASPGQFVNALSDRIHSMMDDYDDVVEVRSVGISAPSANPMTGCIDNPPNLPWKGVVPLAAMLRDSLGMAVVVANDAHVIALAEHTFGAACGMRDFIVVVIGNGLGSSFFSNGHPHVGYAGYAGEVGHVCIEPQGRPCSCGRRGCLESYVSARGIVQTARELLAESDADSLLRQEEKLSPKSIASLCDRGDALAIEVYRRTGETLGLGLANYVSVLDPEAIIFAGGISKAGKWLLEPAREAFERHVYRNISGKVKLLPSELANHECDVIGASVLAWDVKEYSLFK